MSFENGIQKYTITKLNLFLGEAVAQKVNNCGGRKFAIWTEDGTYIVNLKQMIKASQCIAKATPSDKSNQLKYTVEIINKLDKEGNAELKKANLLAKIMTVLRSFFGNIGFSKEKALKELEKLAGQTNKSSEDAGEGSRIGTEDDAYPTLNVKIKPSTTSFAPAEVILPREKEIKIDEKLHTTILKNGIPVAVESYQIGDELTFRLYDANRCIGLLDLIDREEHIEINAYGIPDQNYHHVDDALREIAVRESFKKGFAGRVKVYLHESRDNVSYFKFGFRYEQPLERTLGTLSRDILPLFNDYFSAVKEGRDPAPSLDQIARCESKAMLAALDTLKEEAAIELGRAPNDLQETIDNGFYINWNTVLERVYNHPEEKRDAEIYNNVEEHTRGGWMYLGEEARQHWQHIVES